ncbi:hypothetical protein CYLTODRAFT_495379 [Cylindrobasidium torrendii FP15055 ss-10]|uniref:Ribonuclease H1 N-terminal domain-containing protein n=1 Tax=Cylindrobasidium torrendii FP15055 ss-10 TaxID=1314674 RepID=A0A0D7AV86_9AGAR|nr:hypothetical protein CYLTODRAFT_495379 [Cylindrobasidium torrendii FP15055 ss-10]
MDSLQAAARPSLMIAQTCFLPPSAIMSSFPSDNELAHLLSKISLASDKYPCQPPWYPLSAEFKSIHIVGGHKLQLVLRGQRPGVYSHWAGPDQAQDQVNGFKNASYQGVSTWKQALQLWDAACKANSLGVHVCGRSTSQHIEEDCITVDSEDEYFATPPPSPRKGQGRPHRTTPTTSPSTIRSYTVPMPRPPATPRGQIRSSSPSSSSISSISHRPTSSARTKSLSPPRSNFWGVMLAGDTKFTIFTSSTIAERHLRNICKASGKEGVIVCGRSVDEVEDQFRPMRELLV